MWACCADSSSDDDEHNACNTLLLLFADALVAPALLADLSEVDEFMAALSCRFALDIFTIAQQDRPLPEPDHLAHDSGCDLWSCGTASPGPPEVSAGVRRQHSLCSVPACSACPWTFVKAAHA